MARREAGSGTSNPYLYDRPENWLGNSVNDAFGNTTFTGQTTLLIGDRIVNSVGAPTAAGFGPAGGWDFDYRGNGSSLTITSRLGAAGSAVRLTGDIRVGQNAATTVTLGTIDRPVTLDINNGLRGLDVRPGSTLILPGPVIGNGGLASAGGGTVVLGGRNTYFGNSGSLDSYVLAGGVTRLEAGSEVVNGTMTANPLGLGRVTNDFIAPSTIDTTADGVTIANSFSFNQSLVRLTGGPLTIDATTLSTPGAVEIAGDSVTLQVDNRTTINSTILRAGLTPSLIFTGSGRIVARDVQTLSTTISGGGQLLAGRVPDSNALSTGGVLGVALTQRIVSSLTTDNGVLSDGPGVTRSIPLNFKRDGPNPIRPGVPLLPLTAVRLGAIEDWTYTGEATFPGDVHRLGGGGGTLTYASTITVGSVNVGTNDFANNPRGGTVNLTAANTYAGGTVVTENGRLLVNNAVGSGTGSGAVNVNAGTLGGSGRIGGTVTVGDTLVNAAAARDARLAPGNGVGTLTVAGPIVFAADGMLVIEIDPSAGVADRIVASGVTIDPSAALSLVALSAAAPTPGQEFVLLDSALPIVGTFAGYAEGTTVTAGAGRFRLSYRGGDGNDLTLTAVPEPGGAALFAVAAAFLLGGKTPRSGQRSVAPRVGRP